MGLIEIVLNGISSYPSNQIRQDFLLTDIWQLCYIVIFANFDSFDISYKCYVIFLI